MGYVNVFECPSCFEQRIRITEKPMSDSMQYGCIPCQRGVTDPAYVIEPMVRRRDLEGWFEREGF